MKTNLILKNDSYKLSHWLQMPEGIESSFAYIESRGGSYPSVVFFGLQYYLKEYLTKPITRENIEEAAIFAQLHGEPFNREGWEYILDYYQGYLPVRIRAVPEGNKIPTHNVLTTIESTDPKCFWLPSYLETLLLKVWYPITVASRSYYLRQIILAALEKSADDPMSEIDFKLHSFGYRGVSSEESAGIGGAAELLSFKGSDTINGVLFANHYYNSPMSAFSIPAMEHSTTTAFGKENEVEAYRNMLNHFAKPGALVACVSDSYNLWECIEKYWCGELKEQVINSGATIIIRPDSGIPYEVVLKTLQMLDKGYGHTINSKGYKVLNYVKVIQGDGINEKSLKKIIDTVLENGYSMTNLAFGMGGGMLQELNRDTCKFAQKTSSITINGEQREIFKDPTTDPGKASKAGRLDLIKVEGEYKTVKLDNHQMFDTETEMRTVFLNGKLLFEDDLETIRKRVRE